MKTRDFVRWSVRAAGGVISVPLLQACGGGSKGDMVVPPLAIRNACRRVDLVAIKTYLRDKSGTAIGLFGSLRYAN